MGSSTEVPATQLNRKSKQQGQQTEIIS